MEDFSMNKSKRTTAELYQQLAEDRQEDVDFQTALRREMYAGRITAMEALERFRDHLADGHDEEPHEANTYKDGSVPTVPKLILEMTEPELESASTDQLAAAIILRLEVAESHIWAELDIIDNRIPGFGLGAKIIISDALQEIAENFRTGSIRHWKKPTD
jgi:hypothetical protein